MNNRTLSIILIISILAIIGCGESAIKTPPPLRQQSIKIDDLKPSLSTKKPPEITFQVMTFEIPSENVSILEEIFELLREQTLHSKDPYAFGANGFSAGFGQSSDWQPLGKKLRQAKARKVNAHSLIVFDDQGDDVQAGTVEEQGKYFYTHLDGSVSPQSLGPGYLMFRIKARPVPESRGVAYLSVQPLFSRGLDDAMYRLVGKKRSGETVFDAASFDLKAVAGDFVILSSTEPKQGLAMISELFCRVDRQIKMRNPDLTGDIAKDGRVSAIISRDVNMIRAYVILCTGVTN